LRAEFELARESAGHCARLLPGRSEQHPELPGAGCTRNIAASCS